MSFEYEKLRERHDREQKRAWKSFFAELERLQDEYRATKTEIIQGLGVSRYKYYDFEKDPTQGLSINRSDILNLWAYLADTETRSLPKSSVSARAKLKEDGPDRLLQALGFALLSGSGDREAAIKHPQIKRIVRRLESNWIFDDAVRVYITDKILDQILDLGRPNNVAHREPVELEEVETWPEVGVLKSDDIEVNKKYKGAVQKLIRSGKTEFSSSELFELYQSISEHHYLRPDGDTQLQIINCQFRGLSQSIRRLAERAETYYNRYPPEVNCLKKDSNYRNGTNFKDVSTEAEEMLVQLLVENEENGKYIPSPGPWKEQDAYTNIIASTPCLEARIRFQVESGGETYASSIRYSSTSTHVENMLRAMSQGLGYPLGVSGFSVRATGTTEKSLARISIALSEHHKKTSVPSSHVKASDEPIKNVYEGWWVTSNTITGILSATADAVTRWLHTEEIDAVEYYQACLESANIGQTFFELRKALYEYTPHATEKEDLDESIQKLIKRIQTCLNRYDSRRDEEGFQIHYQNLKNRASMTFLLRVHAALGAGKSLDAKRILDENIPANERYEKNPLSYVIAVYRETCEMFLKLISGDREFLIGRQWQLGDYNPISASLEKLGKYIHEAKNIDFDVYLVVSQLLGTIGILDFYSNPSPGSTTINSYQKSVGFLLKAAHYSLRINHRRRASQWLSFASRLCTRLGDKEKAKELYLIAIYINDNIHSLAVDRQFPLHDSDVNSNWSEVGNFLARGEICLAAQDSVQALKSFLNALGIALRVGYGTAVPDCLYDVARAARQLAETSDERVLKNINPFYKWNSDDLQMWAQQSKGLQIEQIARIVSPILSEFLVDKETLQISILPELAEAFNQGAASIWNQWSGEIIKNAKHPFAQAIEDRSFLYLLSDANY